MVKDSAGPGRCRVAKRTVERETGRTVRWVLRRVVIIEMAGIALGAQAVELPVRMTLTARLLNVLACQRKLGLRMVELSSLPRGG